MDHPDLNLLTDPAFPVITASGALRWTCFYQLLEEDGDFPVAFGWPRADLNVASTELAIGLLSLIYRPVSHKEWEAIWDGRSETDLSERIAALAPHFNLLGGPQGNGPRFCQDIEPLRGDENSVDALFIDTPGVNGQKKNSDLLTHRNRFPALGPKSAAIALYALQQFAPSGGAGNRTSLRGGGPMTTLVIPTAYGSEVPLRCQLLANLPLLFASHWLEDEEIGRALPWLRPTITSEGKPTEEVAETNPLAHPVQSLFGMPRRIRLVVNGYGACSLTGEDGPLVTGFVQKPWGVNYSTWRHPLTPYRQSKDNAPYTVKPKPVRFGFRDWVGITVGRTDVADKAYVAEPVSALTLRMRTLRKRRYEVKLLAAGWAMNNMEAESYLHSVQPLYLAPDGHCELAEDIAATARGLAAAAEEAVRQLRSALNEALFDGQAKATDTSIFEEATDTFYERTEDAFHAPLLKLTSGDDDPAGCETRARAWLSILGRVALSIFDEHASSQLMDKPDVKLAARVTGAYATLAWRLSAASKLAEALGIPQPVEKAKRATSKSAAAAKE